MLKDHNVTKERLKSLVELYKNIKVHEQKNLLNYNPELLEKKL